MSNALRPGNFSSNERSVGLLPLREFRGLRRDSVVVDAVGRALREAPAVLNASSDGHGVGENDPFAPGEA